MTDIDKDLIIVLTAQIQSICCEYDWEVYPQAKAISDAAENILSLLEK